MASSLSLRSARAQEPGLPYWGYFSRALQNLHHPESNPTGVVSFCVAENALSSSLVAEKLREVAGSSSSTPGQLGYDDMRGRHCLRKAFAALAERRITGGAAVDFSHLCVAGGCGALIQHLAFLLCDPGDAMLLVTPTYGMLYNDVGVLGGVAVVDVPVEPGAALTPADLSAASERAVARGLRPKLLFLLNPDNPLGTVRQAEELRGVMEWAAAQGGHFHLVSDEIYALSVYGEEAPGGFTSMAQLARERAGEGCAHYLRDNTHILWGASKDFCASGLRMGVLFSHNAALLGALDNVGYFSAASNPMQDALAAALGDAAWVDGFLAENHGRLRQARDVVCSALVGAGVPHVRPCAGLFVWLDLSAWLEGEGGFEREQKFTAALFESGVLLTPGEAAHSARPGCFRLCFAWHASLDSVREGCARLVRFLAQRGKSPTGHSG